MAPTGDFCFVHAADLHLDTPFKGLSETAPDVGAALREASLEAFDSLVDLCIDRAAAFLVIAGDVYDGSERGLRAQLRFVDGLSRLSDAGISSFVVHGNHDPVEEGWSAISRWPEGVHVFSSAAVEAVPVERGGTVIATVHGISYPRRDVTENLSEAFPPRSGEGLHVGLLHCSVSGAADGHATYSPCTLGDLQSKCFDYWALGHVHAHSVLARSSPEAGGVVVYAGDLQARSPKSSELGEKGAVVVQVRGGRVDTIEHVACDRVRFAVIEADISACEGMADVRHELAEAAIDELERADGRSLVLRARLSGRSAAHGDLTRDGTLEDLLSSLREGGATRPFAWWDRVEDLSLPLLDLDELRGGDDFVSDLLATAEQLAADGLGPADVDELIGKMPRELKRVAHELLEDELDAEVLSEAAVVGAVDRLGLGS